MKLNIGLDWDDTFTADPLTFARIIKVFQSAGHKVYITTARSPVSHTDECYDVLASHGITNVEVHGTSYTSKKRHMLKAGIDIDIWIDDHPTRVHIDEEHEPLLVELPEGVWQK